MSATTSGWIVLAAPLAGTIVTGALFRRLPGRSAGWIATAAIAVSFVFSLVALAQLQSHAPGQRELTSTLWTIAGTTGVDARLTILVDPLSVLMICVVSGVSMLIHLYSVSYLDGDRGYVRFFSYLNYFVFSMLLLVLAGNFVVLIVGWAFVGAASYLLISFWYRRTTATSAGIKAFVINVVGDVGLVLGTFFIFRRTGTLDFVAAFHAAPHVFAHSHGDVVAGCLLLLVGAFAKSAQVPLHTWLPDAMEGPTPVSALIHAATMVTAGVYLIARMHPFFQLAPAAEDVGAIIGTVTLLMAGTIAIAATDLKRVIAYSTMSQIGYMIMGVSIGAYTAGLFHLMTHAFFKALLFMAAGSVISAMGGNQSLDRMSGLRRALPFTFACFVIGGLALSGVPPFSGYFSKDSILLFAAGRGGWYWALYVAGYVGALLTAIYTFRMIFRAFFGEPCPEAAELIDHGHVFHPAEPTNPATGEVEDTESASRPRARDRRAGAADGAGDGPARAAGDRRRRRRDPAHDRLAGQLPRADVRGLAARQPRLRRRAGAGPRARCRAESRRHRDRLHGLGRAAGAVGHDRPPARAADDAVREQVVLRRADRCARRAPGAWFGRFAQNTFEQLFVDGLLVGGATGVVRASSALVRATQAGCCASTWR